MKDQRSYGTSSRLTRKGNEPVFPAERPPPPPPPLRRPMVTGSTIKKGNEMKKKMMMTSSEKKVLAGFMAYEFIKRGTILGHKFDNNALNKGSENSINNDDNNNNNTNNCYKELTSFLMMNKNNNEEDKNKQVEENGVCWITGVVNPSQLATWISGK